MARKTLQDLSRMVFSDEQTNLGIDHLKAGCLQRMAEAMEKSAQLTPQLLSQRDSFKQRFEEGAVELAREHRLHTATKAKLKKIERLLERYMVAMLAIYNHNEAARVAVLQYFPTFKP